MAKMRKGKGIIVWIRSKFGGKARGPAGRRRGAYKKRGKGREAARRGVRKQAKPGKRGAVKKAGKAAKGFKHRRAAARPKVRKTGAVKPSLGMEVLEREIEERGPPRGIPRRKGEIERGHTKILEVGGKSGFVYRNFDGRGIFLETDVDRLLDIITKRGKVKASELAGIFKVPRSKIEEWGIILEDHNLISMHYPPLGEAILMARKSKKRK